MTTTSRPRLVPALFALPCVFAAKVARPVADVLTETSTDAFDPWSAYVASQRKAKLLAQAIEREYSPKGQQIESAHLALLQAVATKRIQEIAQTNTSHV